MNCSIIPTLRRSNALRTMEARKSYWFILAAPLPGRDDGIAHTAESDRVNGISAAIELERGACLTRVIQDLDDDQRRAVATMNVAVVGAGGSPESPPMVNPCVDPQIGLPCPPDLAWRAHQPEFAPPIKR